MLKYGPATGFAVPVAATAVVVRWPDDRRQLVGTDGTVVVVEPTLWVDGRRLVEHVDRTWPRHLVVERPARPPHEIPQPDYGTDGRNVPPPADGASRSRGWLHALKARGSGHYLPSSAPSGP